jgi:hypothetical protein
MSSNQTYPIPPTGRQTYTLDWAADLAVPPRCGATLVAASWTVPSGITVAASSIDGSKAVVTLNSVGLKVNGTYTAICTATLSNGDIIPSAVLLQALYRNTRRSAEVCPTP